MTDKTDDTNIEIPLGTWLKENRKSKNVSLEEIAAVTKVHISQLKMIEEDQWKTLPAPAFVRGFLLCYSQHLGLNDEEVLRRYKIAMGNQIKTIEATLPAGFKSVQSGSQPKVRVASAPNFQRSPGAKEIDYNQTPFMTPQKLGIIVAGIVAIVLLVVLISLGKKSDSPKSEESAPVAKPTVVETPSTPPAEVSDAVAPTTVTTPVPSAAPTPNTPVVPALTLELIGVEESWVIIRNNGKASEGFSLKPKERRTFEIDTKVQLVLSNAGALEMKWNGKHYEAPGFRGDVKRLQLPEQINLLKEKKIRVAPRVVAPAPGLPGQEPGLPGASPIEY